MFSIGDNVTVVRKNDTFNGIIEGKKPNSRTIYLVQDNDKPTPSRKAGGWSRGTNNDYGKTFEIHKKYITKTHAND